MTSTTHGLPISRKPRAAVPAFLCAAILGGSLLSGPALAEDWLRWGGPTGDFKVQSGPLAESWPEDGPPQLWKRPLGEGYSSILYQNGRLFTMYRKGDEEIIIALDARTGKTVWEHRDTPKLWRDMTHQFGRGPNTTPLIVGDRLIAAGVAGRIQALDKDSGRPIWQHDLPSNVGRRRRMEEYGYSGNPLPYDGHVIVLAGSDQQAVIALDPKDGSTVWTSDPGSVSYAQPTIAKLAGRDQYIYFSTHGVVGLDPKTGKTLWRAPIEFANGNHLTPAVPCDDRHVWIGSQFSSGGGRLLEITGTGDRLSAKQLWFETSLQASHWTMIRLGDWIYGSIGGNRTSFLAAFHWKTGEIAWRQRGFHKAQSLYADGKLIFLDEDGQLALAKVSPDGVEVLASAQITQSVSWALPTLVGTTLYLRDQEDVFALELGR